MPRYESSSPLCSSWNSCNRGGFGHRDGLACREAYQRSVHGPRNVAVRSEPLRTPNGVLRGEVAGGRHDWEANVRVLRIECSNHRRKGLASLVSHISNIRIVKLETKGCHRGEIFVCFRVKLACEVEIGLDSCIERVLGCTDPRERKQQQGHQHRLRPRTHPRHQLPGLPTSEPRHTHVPEGVPMHGKH